MIKARNLGRYIREIDREEESVPTVDRTTTGVVALSESISAINYILGGPLDQYQSKCNQKKLLRASTVKALVNAIHTRGIKEETKPIDEPISFPPVNLNRVILPFFVLFVC